MENQRQPYDKFFGKRIAFEELVKLIGQDCDYKFAIIDYGVDEELMAIAKTEGIDLTGYKHVIETSGTNHSQNRHGEKSNDRMPLSIEDYLLVPYIIKFRDGVEISNNNSRSHHHRTFIYRKAIGEQYVYVEEIRIGRNKSLAFQTLYKRPIKKPPD